MQTTFWSTLVFAVLFTTVQATGQPKGVTVTVLDSLTAEPVINASLLSGGHIITITDFDGNTFIKRTDAKVDSLTIVISDYYTKSIGEIFTRDSLVVLLVPRPALQPSINSDFNLIIEGESIDTTYFKNGRIAQVRYTKGGLVSFYKSGETRSTTVGRVRRDWFKNGQLLYESRLITSHRRLVTTWHKNGQKKSQGSMIWNNAPDRKGNHWRGGNDWQYWDKRGQQTWPKPITRY